jgi:hypothetical protein
MIMELMQRFFARPAAPTSTSRMTDAEALELAHRATDGKLPLYVISVLPGRQGLEWQIGTTTIGSGVLIRIDDATGAIIESGQWGKR